jgi:threonylcarbamoyladenosine tRNA methylthiotransferase MtaB
MFENTLASVDELGLTYLHVFPFSPRPGTPAARMPQVPMHVRKERAARLRAAGEGALMRFLRSRVGHTAPVLVEGARLGRCPHYAPVRLDFDTSPGRVVYAHFDGVAGRRLTARKAA